jgi:hypothetical protein
MNLCMLYSLFKCKEFNEARNFAIKMLNELDKSVDKGKSV